MPERANAPKGGKIVETMELLQIADSQTVHTLQANFNLAIWTP